MCTHALNIRGIAGRWEPAWHCAAMGDIEMAIEEPEPLEPDVNLMNDWNKIRKTT